MKPFNPVRNSLYYLRCIALAMLVCFNVGAFAQNLQLSISNQPKPIANFDGHNASFMQEVFQCDFNGGFNLSGYGHIQQISPKLLRFPGGKLSQYVHLMQGPGYGLDSTEIMADFSGTELNEWLGRLDNQDTLSCRYIDAFIEFVANINDPELEVLFVVNLDNGTIQENTDAITHLINNGVNVVGVEMGNEHYRDQTRYPSITDYMNHSVPYANDILSNHSSLKIGWVAAPPITSNQQIFGVNSIAHFEAWNQGLAQYKDDPYFDAYISHIYFNSYFFQCSQLYDAEYDQNNLTTLNNTFNLGTNLFNNYIRDSIPKVLNEYTQYFGNNEKLWITEWNFAKPSDIFGNTILDASYTMKFINQMNRLNPGQNNIVEYMCRQKLAGPFFNSQNSISPKSSWDDVSTPYVRRTSYYPFLLLNELYEGDFQLLETSTINNNFQYPVFAQAYYDGSDNEFLIVIVNENSNPVQMAPADIKVTDWAGQPVSYNVTTPYQLEYIQGDQLYTSAGITNYYYQNVNFSTTNKPPFIINDVEDLVWGQTAANLTFPARSIGVLRFRADDVLQIDDLLQQHANVKLYPNPSFAGNEVNIESEIPISGSIQLLDATGRLIEEFSANEQTKITFAIDGYSPGLYTVLVGTAAKTLIVR